jgi:hypothetical protein
MPVLLQNKLGMRKASKPMAWYANILISLLEESASVVEEPSSECNIPLRINGLIAFSCLFVACLKTQTVNSIPNCFNLEVVPFPAGM